MKSWKLNICCQITGAICRPPQRINQKLPSLHPDHKRGGKGGGAQIFPLSNKYGGEHVPQHHHGPDADVQGSRKGVHNVHIVNWVSLRVRLPLADCNATRSGTSEHWKTLGDTQTQTHKAKQTQTHKHKTYKYKHTNTSVSLPLVQTGTVRGKVCHKGRQSVGLSRYCLPLLLAIAFCKTIVASSSPTQKDSSFHYIPKSVFIHFDSQNLVHGG